MTLWHDEQAGRAIVRKVFYRLQTFQHSAICLYVLYPIGYFISVDLSRFNFTTLIFLWLYLAPFPFKEKEHHITFFSHCFVGDARPHVLCARSDTVYEKLRVEAQFHFFFW